MSTDNLYYQDQDLQVQVDFERDVSLASEIKIFIKSPNEDLAEYTKTGGTVTEISYTAGTVYCEIQCEQIGTYKAWGYVELSTGEQYYGKPFEWVVKEVGDG